MNMPDSDNFEVNIVPYGPDGQKVKEVHSNTMSATFIKYYADKRD